MFDILAVQHHINCPLVIDIVYIFYRTDFGEERTEKKLMNVVNNIWTLAVIHRCVRSDGPCL